MTTKSTPMDEGQPSSTARRAALLRAAHQILDNPKVLDDPMALRIIGIEGESWVRSNLERLQEARFLRAFIVARSRYAEDGVARAVERGTRQYVILGSGLETFPYRNPYPESRLHVYEVDHPATQSWKRKRLVEAGITIPNSLTFAPVDFERQTLADALGGTRFEANQPAFFSFLGVIIYLTREAVMGTFGFVASLPAGSEIVFDCPVETTSLNEAQKVAREARADRIAAIGEPWQTFFDPPSLASDLRQMGFGRIEDLGPEAANKRYFEDRTDGLRIAGGSHLMKARV